MAIITDNEIIRLIFGFKVRYLRQQHQLSYQELSNLTGLSTSYLNDIEKGKKYPKPDKIKELAKAFEMDYNYMVSTTATRKLQPVIDLLDSKFLRVFPLEEFGISIEKLIDLFTNTPDKVNAFISTFFKLAQRFHLGEDEFFKVALRSYRDMHEGYFAEIEEAVQTFRSEHLSGKEIPVRSAILENKLKELYGISVERSALSQHAKLRFVRSYFMEKSRKLLLNSGLSNAQESFLMAREIGFHNLGLEERPFVTRMLEIPSFEKLLNNFKASYFAAALLMDEEEMVKDIQYFARQNTWQPELLLRLLNKYNVTQEMLAQRITNLLPKHFGIHDLYFLRISGSADLRQFDITKELHLSQRHDAHSNELDEHYCHRWISINILLQLRTHLSTAESPELGISNAQLSKYWETPNTYLNLSLAKPDFYNPKKSVSVTIGMLVNPQLRSMFNFLDDPALLRKEVHTTCERCSIPDCGARVAPPLVIESIKDRQDIQKKLRSLNE
ncbi:MAG: helix-turn-helix domain-containing protein [Bacteroidota bacterium]